MITHESLIRSEKSEDERKRLEDEKKPLQKRHNALQNLVVSLQAALSSTAEEVKRICAGEKDFDIAIYVQDSSD